MPTAALQLPVFHSLQLQSVQAVSMTMAGVPSISIHMLAAMCVRCAASTTVQCKLCCRIHPRPGGRQSLQQQLLLSQQKLQQKLQLRKSRSCGSSTLSCLELSNSSCGIPPKLSKSTWGPQ